MSWSSSETAVEFEIQRKKLIEAVLARGGGIGDPIAHSYAQASSAVPKQAVLCPSK